MGRFKGLAGVKTNQGGIYFLDGDYEVEFEECKFEHTRKGDTWITKAKVIKSTNPERAPGVAPSWVVVLKPEYIDTCMGDIKGFAAAVLGINNPDAYVPEGGPEGERPEDKKARTDKFWDDTLEYIVSDAQPLRGMRIGLNVVTIMTKKEKPFGKHTWKGPAVDPNAARPAA